MKLEDWHTALNLSEENSQQLRADNKCRTQKFTDQTEKWLNYDWCLAAVSGRVWITRIKNSTRIPVRPGISLLNQPRHAVNVEALRSGLAWSIKSTSRWMSAMIIQDLKTKKRQDPIGSQPVWTNDSWCGSPYCSRTLCTLQTVYTKMTHIFLSPVFQPLRILTSVCVFKIKVEHAKVEINGWGFYSTLWQEK